MENFIQYASHSDKRILMEYVSKCKTIHIGIAIWSYSTAVTFIVRPFLTKYPFPTDAVYSFPTNNIYSIIFIYAQQSLAAVQTSAAVLLDCLIAVLLWFVCARLEILSLSLRNCDNYKDLLIHIKQHQNLLRYVNDVNETIDLFVISTLVTSVGGVIFSTIQLVSPDMSLAEKAQYGIVAVTASFGLFICSWAADSMLDMGYVVGVNAFNCKWYGMEQRSKTCVQRLVMQCQCPLKIEANPLLPNLTLEFFAQFALLTFKIFTSLRVMVS